MILLIIRMDVLLHCMSWKYNKKFFKAWSQKSTRPTGGLSIFFCLYVPFSAWYTDKVENRNAHRGETMEFGTWVYYLIIINIFGFLLFAFSAFLRADAKSGHLDTVLMIVSFLGGSLGIVLAILLMDRKPEKENMMLRVFVLCMLVIQTVLVLFLCGAHDRELSFAFWELIAKDKRMVLYLLTINIVTFIAFAVDKYKAVKHHPRIKIVTLLGLAALGGTIGGLLAMLLFRHKIRKNYFAVGMPMILLTRIILMLYIVNL